MRAPPLSGIQPAEPVDPGNDPGRLRELELELIKTRAEAKAARLEARAAELELMIRRLADSESEMSRIDSGQTAAPIPKIAAPTNVTSATSDTATPDVCKPPEPARFSSWDELRKASPGGFAEAEIADAADGSESELRFDSPEPVGAPHFDPTDQSGFDPSNLSDPTDQTDLYQTDPKDLSDSIANPDLEVDGEPDQELGRKSKPAALLASLFAHIAILLLMAAFTLTKSKPKDQVALSASVSESNEPEIESISIETQEPETPQTQPTEETQYEISEVGQMPITELKPIEVAGPPAPKMDSSLTSDAFSSASMSMKSDSESSMQFCGVEGGGNHFVYLVDSSGSMGSAFESARAELLDSIQQLKPEQRFYVVFFDAESDYMRLSDPSTDESRSVRASPQNKQLLSQWAMAISMDRGKAPYDPIKFAVDLQPDVIFLLSDGEFPQGIEDLFQEINRHDNLFGDDGPISIVHTIGYHSREGETRMKRIAKQNGGQYRHVPKP